MNLTTVLVSGALAVSLLSQPASAMTERRDRVVSTADLDLANAKDRDVLERRLTAAVAEVCRPTPMPSIRDRADYGHCTAEAYAAARTNADRLIAAMTNRTPRVASN